jgi:hypothetical protein
MFCGLVAIIIGVCVLLVAWGMRSMIVSGAGWRWWVVWWGLIFAGIGSGSMWAASHPPALMPGEAERELRGIVTVLSFGFWCFSITFSLLFIHTGAALFRFGLWPRSPEQTRGFPVITNAPSNHPLTKH